ncbi:GAF domain-containing sensor histidine kinase [Sulfurospirillum arcachonense]|uniref:GAF domain-containing sensor histidine kinase n=1 Tax=Sulfurospirillum arcachonense TaxID=57666 RepID=UPI00046A1E4A|nr:GAF domain-containing sensor histidine kinase [Sulfurospirillum arcachonense]
MNIEVSIKKLKKRVYILLATTVFVFFIALLVLFIYLESSHVSAQEKRFHNNFITSKKESLDYTIHKYRSYIKTMSDIDIMKNYIKNEDRKKLQLFMKDRLALLKKENPYIKVFHFYFDNTSPSLKLDNAKALIEKVHKNQKTIYSHERLDDKVILSIVMPMFDQKNYIGAFKIGIDLDYFVQKIKKELKCPSYVFLKSNNSSSEKEFFLISKVDKTQQNILNSIDKKSFFQNSHKFSLDHKEYIANVVDIKNVSQDVIAKLLCINDITYIKVINFKVISHFIFFSLLIFLILLFFLKKKIKVLERILTKLHKKHSNKLNNLNNVLQVILDINKNIIKIKDKDLLLEKVCEILVQSNLFSSVWIVKSRKDGCLKKVIEKGLEASFTAFNEEILAGKIPECIKSMADKKLVYIHNREEFCQECTLKELQHQDSLIVLKLEYQSKVYGYMGASVSTKNLNEKRINRLLVEVAENIAFSLYNIELEEKQKQAKIQLMQHKEQLEELVQQRTMKLNESLEKLQNTQNSLIEAEKMSALGRLVAGVAHEINTPIGLGITSMSHFIGQTKRLNNLHKTNQMKKSSFEEYLNESTILANITFENLKRAAELIRSFKQISVDQINLEKREFFLRAYVEETFLSFFNKIKKTKIKVELNCDENIEIQTYPGALSQIITNLVMNSLIHGYNEDSEGTIRLDFTVENATLHLVYKDDGKGISDVNIKKIFDPFFTTKRGKGGTGLGLNVIYNIIVQQLKGTIECISKEGEGVEFIIEIPLEKSLV